MNKSIINISLWVLAILALMVFEVFAMHQHANSICGELKLELKNQNDYPILTSEIELRTELLQNYTPIEGQKRKSLQLEQIEKKVGQISYLEKHIAFMQIDGNMIIKASPRKGVIRIYNKAGQHFYLGTDTVVMPLSPKHSLRLLFANGALPKLKDSFFNQSGNDMDNLPTIYKKIYILAAKIQDDKFLNALIDQIYIKPNQEIELIPKAGISYIEFGDFADMDNKLERLKTFYIKGQKKVDWNIYKSINLKYENQVVCTKK